MQIGLHERWNLRSARQQPRSLRSMSVVTRVGMHGHKEIDSIAIKTRKSQHCDHDRLHFQEAWPKCSISIPPFLPTLFFTLSDTASNMQYYSGRATHMQACVS